MAKLPNSIIGLDLGRYSLKSVLMQRRGKDGYTVTHYGSHVPDEPATTADALGRQIKALLRDMGASAKVCAVSVSSPDALIRIIEQPETPPHILRDALRLNGMTLLNQDCKELVLDCDVLGKAEQGHDSGQYSNAQVKYLVGGVPRGEIETAGEAVEGAGLAIRGVQLAPICAFNSFEIAHPEIFNEDAFFLVEIGHIVSTMMVGVKRELALVRSIDFGGKALFEALIGLSGEGRESVLEALEQEDEVMVEYTRVAINTLAREIGSSIGFFEARREETIRRVFLSGGPAKSRTFLKLMSEELGMPCESWCAAEKCEVALPANRREDFAREALDLNVACGAAVVGLSEK